jgi:hypothetical protein
MKMGLSSFAGPAFLAAAMFSSTAPLADEVDYAHAIAGIAEDIAKLKPEYPQLEDFSSASNSSVGEFKIAYDYHTHQAQGRGGWTSGVPNPDADGIWFYIDFHDADSTAQIHTQPMTAPICLGKRRVSFLILEGTQTKSLDAAIFKILQKYGANNCSE